MERGNDLRKFIERGLAAILFLMTLYAQASSTTKMPSNYSMECPTHPYQHRSLSIKAIDDRVDFFISEPGTKLWPYKNLINNTSQTNIWDIDTDWGTAELSFSVPLDSCAVSAEDAQILACGTGDSKTLTLKVKLSSISDGTWPKDHVEEVEVKWAWVQIRKVHTTSSFSFSSFPTGYELVLGQTLSWPHWKPVFIHSLVERRCQTNF